MIKELENWNWKQRIIDGEPLKALVSLFPYDLMTALRISNWMLYAGTGFYGLGFLLD